MLRVSRARGLWVTDVPRRNPHAAAPDRLRAAGFRTEMADGLLYVDLTADTYARWACGYAAFAGMPGPWTDAWRAEQALLQVLCARGASPPFPASAEDALRSALRACMAGDAAVRARIDALRAEAAVALRCRAYSGVRIVAGCMAAWLSVRGIGIPVRYDAFVPDDA